MLLRVKNGETHVVGEKVAPSPLPPSFQRALGTYEPVNLGDDEKPHFRTIRIERRDGLLTADLAARSIDDALRFVLLPVSDGEAIIAGLGRGLGETIHFAQDGDEVSLFYSGLEFKKKSPPPQ